MAKDIVVVKSMGDALRNTGYKNIESAVSEIIDNSIQANAKDVFIIITQTTDPSTGRKGVTEFAFLDNGEGMNIDDLGACLGIGYTTRSDRKGMGRFGVGLPQASLHVTPTVDVYSWQNGYENCRKVFLDMEKVKSGEQTEIDDPIKAEIPEQYVQYLTYQTLSEQFDFTHSGTLVHWKNCDRVIPKSMSKVIERLDFALGQKFRYLIKDGAQSIRVFDTENDDQIKVIQPNDPLFLMENNYILGDPENPGSLNKKGCGKSDLVPIFEPYIDDTCVNGAKLVPVKYYKINSKTGEKEIATATVEVRFSKVKNIFYDQTAFPGDPGRSSMGQHVGRLEGISIVRAKREIDFGRFNYYKAETKTQHRWWGCEVCFDPILDEAFGVSNNKQHVELTELDKREYEDDPVQPVWLQLYDVICKTIDTIYKKNETIRGGSRKVADITPPAVTIINKVEEETKPLYQDEADNDIVQPTDEEVEEARNDVVETLVEQGIKNPTDEDVNQYLKNKVNILYKNLGRAPLFDYSFPLGSISLKINTEHPFYKYFLTKAIESNSDAKTTFELFIASLVKEIGDTNQYQAEQNDKLMQKWDNKLRDYIYGQYGTNK